MAKLNVLRTIENTNINPRYDISYENIIDVQNNCNDIFAMGDNFFKLGYAQGLKAAKAEMMRNNRLNGGN